MNQELLLKSISDAIPILPPFIQTAILFWTALIVRRYTEETKRLREEASRQTAEAQKQAWDTHKLSERTVEQTIFQTATAIHERLNNKRSYELRDYIQRDLAYELGNAVGNLYPESENIIVPAEGGGCLVNLSTVALSMKEDQELLQRFHRNLRVNRHHTDKTTPLQIAEEVLLDFDIIAQPVFLGLPSAIEVAAAYKSALRATARPLLQFIAIQRLLRGSSDPDYNMHYLHLLDKLDLFSELEPEYQFLRTAPRPAFTTP